MYVTTYATSSSEGGKPSVALESALLIPYSHRLAARPRPIVIPSSIPGPTILASATNGLADAGPETTTVDIATSPANSTRIPTTHLLLGFPHYTARWLGGSQMSGRPGQPSLAVRTVGHSSRSCMSDEDQAFRWFARREGFEPPTF